MLVFELHDETTGDLTHGTTLAEVGRGAGISELWHVHVNLQSFAGLRWRRAYLLDARSGEIVAIWAQDMRTHDLCLVACSECHRDLVVAPFVPTSDNLGLIAFRRGACSEVEAKDWADKELSRGAFSAIVVRDGRVSLVWERGADGAAQLVSRGRSFV